MARADGEAGLTGQEDREDLQRGSPKSWKRTAVRAAGVGLGLLALGGAGAAGCGDTGSEGTVAGGKSTENVAQAGQALSAPQVCISIQRGLSGIVADTILANKAPPQNFGTSAALLTGLVGGTQRESLLQFDLSAIPAGATINSAILTLYDGNIAPQGQSDIKVHRVTAAWNETTVTYQSFNQAFNPAQSAIFSNSLNPATTNSLVPLVQSWASGTFPNYGMLLEQAYVGTNVTQFKSSEDPTVAQRPRLDVCYTVVCAAGTADCDNNGTNGCETNTTTITNCGSCGNVCSFPNSAPACVGGACAIGSCNAGFGDCDGQKANGCETSLTTAVDCGGCGVACALPNGSSTCATGTCTLTTCNNGFFDCDGNPSDGCEALPCANGQHCGHGTDCASGVCQNGFCAAPTCSDGVQNGSETSTDCGGNTCPPCADFLGCAVASDCIDGVCQGGICQPSSCTDGVKNGGETGPDCGGPRCGPCADGIGCAIASDCQSGVCVGGVCQAAACNDGVKNGSETGVDCGGGTCAPCADGLGCAVGSDCQNLVCVGNVCQMAACNDGVKNGKESDVDCGGYCPPCNNLQLCQTSADCTSGVCVNGTCQLPTCSDGVKNGNETGVDCGGACYVPEVCDGVDNDCNGLIDDGLGNITCGVGACQVTVAACVNGANNTCVPGTPVAEICDGLLDDDCDGVVDNGCACVNGTTQGCYDGSAATNNVGTCHGGTQTCVMGQWAACVGEVLPTAETCDSLDNDCNGQVDDNLGVTVCGVGTCQATVQNCVGGQVQTCVPGQPKTEVCDGLDNDCNGAVDDGLGTISCGTGACAATAPACVNGAAGVCVPGNPSPETCDGIDNDCNGVVDNGNPGGGANCSTGNQGVCAAGTTACTNGGIVCNQNVQPSAETCDGLDNDCNGVIDNGNPGGGVGCNTGNQGICSAGTTVCSSGHVTCSQNLQPTAETCDGLDNDCNGVVDNGNPGGGQSCSTGLQGVCSGGTTACTGGGIVCNQNLQATAEICDGLKDENCNGQVDEGCNCVNGSTQSCYTGANGTAGVGTCHAGTQTCVNGNFGACVGQVVPTAETCDGKDNNCNGQVDDGLGTISCGVGACGNTVPACVNGSANTCTPKAPTAEVCDGIDNNCDGVVDNGNPGGNQACSTGKSGICAAGTTACVSGAIVCNQTNSPAPETCNGLDDDCNGVVDNGNPGGAVACSTGQQGVCSAGTTACTAGAIVCNRNVNPTTETCDGLDNDCNGVVDNGNPGGGANCSTGKLGVCSAGTTACTGGAVVCNQNIQATAETCDGKDNDCNGVVDNGNPGGGANCSTGLQGICSAGTTACTGGSVVCNQNLTAKAETCNGLDDDCNGVVDNGNPGGGVGCNTGQAGICNAGTTACTSGTVVCNRNSNPTTETCNGLDDDCNGVVDNGNPGGGVGCNTGQAGVCAAGTTACTSGAIACNRNVAPSAEVCDGKDNDCNGVVDNGNPGGGQACNTGQAGVCAAGTTACTSGTIACNRNQGPSTEVCDGVDNDCNGQTDLNAFSADGHPNTCGTSQGYGVGPGGQVDITGIVDPSGDDYFLVTFTSVPGAGQYYHPKIDLINSAGGQYVFQALNTGCGTSNCGGTLTTQEMSFPSNPNSCLSFNNCSDATSRTSQWIVRVTRTSYPTTCSTYTVRISNL